MEEISYLYRIQQENLLENKGFDIGGAETSGSGN
jgi:hypothetical protein